MAVWQFKINLYPREAVISFFGVIPSQIDFDISPPGHVPSVLASAEPNLWGDRQFADTCAAAKKVLPEIESWCDQARMFGNNESNSIEVWPDAVYVRLDCRNIELAMVDAIVSFANDLVAVLVEGEGGLVFESSRSALLEVLYKSTASRFVSNPLRVISQVGRK